MPLREQQKVAWGASEKSSEKGRYIIYSVIHKYTKEGYENWMIVKSLKKEQWTKKNPPSLQERGQFNIIYKEKKNKKKK